MMTGEYLFPLNVIRGGDLFWVVYINATLSHLATLKPATGPSMMGESRAPKNKREKMKINWSK